MLKADNLTFSYSDGAPMQFPSIDCGKGEHWLLLGDSGSGKTTLLHLLAGLRKPKSGSVEVDGQNIYGLSTAELDKFRGRNIGMIFQTAHFVRSLNVKENLRLAQKLAGNATDDAAIESILGQLNINSKVQKYTHQLSVGEQQRVAIARALINKPAVIFADEPTSALDDNNTEQVLQLLKKQAESVGATLLIVTHDNRLKSQFTKQIVL